jgi:DNA-binding response OmpR family regulator
MQDVRGDCGPILVADDDETLRALVAAVLESAGYRTVEAADGPSALRAARDEQPAALILDIEMPVLSGYEVCARVRKERGPGVPIIFLSGSRTEAMDRVAGLMLGADDFLTKPFAPDELLARLRGLLRRAAAELPRREGLTRREHEVLELLGEGLAQREIAQRLGIASRTVGSHVERILVKLDVHSRAHAVARAYREGLLR